jgi:hypothetical protein
MLRLTSIRGLTNITQLQTDSNITLSSVANNMPLMTELGYFTYSGAVQGSVVSSPFSTNIEVYSPSIGTSELQLSAGVYTACVYAYLEVTGTITSAGIHLEYGLRRNTTTSTTGSVNVPNGTIQFNNLDMTSCPVRPVYYTNTFCFLVPSTAYYYAFQKIHGFTSLSGTSPTVRPCVQLVSLLRVA